jgi:tRNA G18 (ribose-2'-O)-methylase SpoU
VSRLVAVLGYSDGSESGLHPVCAARLERAAEVACPDDVVLFSGWSHGGASASEAELMAQARNRPARKVVLDRGASTTAGNAIGIARTARALGVDEVVVVTSSWHGRRARTLARAALAGTRARVQLVTTDETSRRAAQARELACWSLVPVLALVAARAR